MELQSGNLNFLNDIESLLKKSFCEKLRCIVFNIESAILNQNNQMLELSAIEIENFKITGKIFWIHINPRDFISNNLNDLHNERYYAYSEYWEYYVQDSKKKLKNFIDFIGNDSYLISYDIISDYDLLKKELKFWNLPEIEKNRFRSINQIGNKVFELKKKESLLTLEEFYFHYKIYEYPNEIYYNSNLCNCMMNAKLFIHLWDDFYNIYNKLNMIDTINIEKQNVQKIEKEEIKKNIDINSFNSEMNNIKEKEIKKEKFIDIKSFNSELGNTNLNEKVNEQAVAYISNSYNENKDIYLYGGFILLNNKRIDIKGVVDDETYIKAGAPGAEMFGCIQLINKAIDLKIKIINIISSYTGIKYFAEKIWTTKKKAPVEFIKYIEKIVEMYHIELNFDYIKFELDDNFRKAKIIANDYGNSINYKKTKEIQKIDKIIK